MPWLAALVPIPVGVGLALFLGPQLLAFALLGPVMLLASALGDRWGAGRGARRDLAAHAAAVGEARDRLAAALAVERLRLDRLHPDPQAVLATVEHRMPGLWVGDDRLVVRLGVGETPTRVAWAEDGTRSHPSAAGMPVTVSLRDVECLGVVGPDDLTNAVLRSVVGQLCAAHPPTRLVMAVASSSAEWSWSRWLPHLVDVAATPDAVGLPTRRRVAVDPAPAHVLVVPARDTGPPGDVVSAARAAGWLVVVAARERASLPRGWGSVLVTGHGRTHTFESGSGPPVPVVPDLVGLWWSDRLARALAPLRCAEPEAGRATVPDAVGLTDLLGSAAADPEAMVEGWARRQAAVEGSPRRRPSSGAGRTASTRST